ncbi:MAG: flagellar basal body P-ring formation protein FlgA [Nitrosomonadales bacterium]|nr:flagellar basal body P-ring formation protein FlgA [Nitrosomonadales bacterium]
MKKRLLINLLLLLSVVAAPPAQASPKATQDHARIKAVVTAFVRQQVASLPGQVTTQIGEIDNRLVLPACTNLEAFLPAGSQFVGKTSVGVRCQEENGWSIFVPVQVKISVNLLVSTHPLTPGHTIEASDITTQTSEIGRNSGLSNPELAIGKVVRFGIGAGQVLREDMLRLPYSVTQGMVVQVAAQGSGFSIRSEGVALNNASTGQAVQVRVGSGRVISGIAGSSGVVVVTP